MRRRLKLVPVLAVLLLAPTGAQAGAGDYVVCDSPPAGTTVLKPGTSPTSTIASPGLRGDTTTRKFMLDLYPAKATNRASVAATLNWEIPVNDFDLSLLDPSGAELGLSANEQTTGDAPTESVGKAFYHCGLFTIQVYNFLALGGARVDGVDPLQLTMATGNVT